MSERKWVRRSLRRLREMLNKEGYYVSHPTVGRLLRKLNYGLKGNNKRFTGPAHPERDQQMRYIQRVTKLFRENGHPILSLDTKKKELIGNFKNAGQVWRRKAEEVNAHDFPSDALVRAVPYGIYDLIHNQGFVCVGTSADTSEFAVDNILKWWHYPGRPTFPDESKLLLLCDAGGSNGYRKRLWKQQIQEKLADALGVQVMTCHYPTGASKWNPIEHRLFSQISINWAGKPLRSLQIMLNYIRDTTTSTGLSVEAVLSDTIYQKGLKVSSDVWDALLIKPRSICHQWNYIISPRSFIALD